MARPVAFAAPTPDDVAVDETVARPVAFAAPTPDDVAVAPDVDPPIPEATATPDDVATLPADAVLPTASALEVPTLLATD
jgi:hypothetical protein